MNMKRMTVVCIAAVALTGSAFAQGNKPAQPGQMGQSKGAQAMPAAQPMQPAQPAQAGGAPAMNMSKMDMSKMGPASRKPTNEKQTKQEIMDFFKAMDEAHKKGDMDAMWAAHDFPIFMLTDDMKGMTESKTYSREEFIAEMKPYMEGMPKDMNMTHKPTVTVLSDNLANVVDDFTMTMGKQKISGKNAGLLVKRDGKWLWKAMVEAGWGGMSNTNMPMPAEGKK
jgi:hypothetical protein